MATRQGVPSDTSLHRFLLSYEEPLGPVLKSLCQGDSLQTALLKPEAQELATWQDGKPLWNLIQDLQKHLLLVKEIVSI